MSKRYLIHLKDALKKSGLTPYSVAKQLGLNKNTVRKYLEQDVTAEYLPTHVIDIVEFLGLDWRNPDVIEVIEVEEPKKYRIKLRDAHKRRGLSIPQIASKIGVPPNTIREYVEVDEVLTNSVPMIVQLLAEVYGVRMSDVIEEMGGESPEMKAALALDFEAL